MNFKTWWEKEGSVMFEGNCSAEITAEAAWQASNRMIELGEEILNDPTISEMIKAMVRIEIENQKRLMEAFSMR